jgi:hypothetical protein
LRERAGGGAEGKGEEIRGISRREEKSEARQRRSLAKLAKSAEKNEGRVQYRINDD